jgi:hypothetical protein
MLDVAGWALIDPGTSEKTKNPIAAGVHNLNRGEGRLPVRV